MEFLLFSLYLLSCVLPLDTTEKSHAPSSLNPPMRYLCTLLRSPWVFSSAGWRFPALLTSQYVKYSKPFILMTIHWTDSRLSISFLYWGAKTWTQHSDVSLQCWAERRDHLPQAAGETHPNRPKEAVVLLCHRGALLAHGPLAVHHNPKVLLSELLSIPLAQNLYWCMSLFLCRGRSLYFPLFNSMRCLSAHFPSL